MRSRIANAGFLLSFAATVFADPYPSAIDTSTNIVDIKPRSDGDSLTMMGAMNKLQKHDTIMSLFKRNLGEMNDAMALLYPRQVATIPTDPKTGNTGSPNFDLAAWDAEVIDACDDHMILFGSLVTKKTDPAGVGVCYNIPFYNATSGAFASDIRLWKIANGTDDWEAAGTKISLSVQYQGATVKLATAAGNGTASASSAGGDKITTQNTKVSTDAKKTTSNGAKKPSGGQPDLFSAEANVMVGPPPKSSSKSASQTASAKSTQTGAMLGKRMEMAQMQPAGADAVAYEIQLLQTMRFVGQVNPDVMKNASITKNPSIMKLVLTPSLLLMGQDATGKAMNASVSAAQIQYVAGAFSNITIPAPPAAPFKLPGTAISIFPLGLYLFSVYMILFLVVVGWGTVERYLFRMSFRKRSAMMSGHDGVGKI